MFPNATNRMKRAFTPTRTPPAVNKLPMASQRGCDCPAPWTRFEEFMPDFFPVIGSRWQTDRAYCGETAARLPKCFVFGENIQRQRYSAAIHPISDSYAISRRIAVAFS